MDYKTILYETEDVREGRVAKITLNQPEKLNVWNAQQTKDFHAALDEAEEDDNVKVVILKGAGRVFSAGFDLNEVGETGWFSASGSRPNLRGKLRFNGKRTMGYLRLFLFPKITIAQVHGLLMGRGLVTAEVCDMCVAAESTKIGHAQQHLGHGGQVPSMALLMMSVGPKKAMEFLITGKYIDATEAERIGWINHAFPDDKLEEETMKLAKACCLMPADGIAIGKYARQLVYERMGLMAPMFHFAGTHALYSSMSLSRELDEFRFLHTVKEKGMRAAIKEREGRFEGLVDGPPSFK